MLPLSERQQKILFCIIEQFNQSGDPVGSAAVARRPDIGVSSATIRNVMGELEEMGLVMQPHTSAGRIPTSTGMRFYVNELSAMPRAADSLGQDWARHFESLVEDGIDATARAAGLLVSRLSRLTSIVSLPGLAETKLREINLALLSERRVLVILITEDGRIFKRATRVADPIDEVTLTRMQNYLSELALGLTLRQLRARVSEELADAESRYRAFVHRALILSKDVLEATPASQLYVEGTLHILEFAELTADVHRLREVLYGLENRERVLEMLDRICDAPSPKTLIGSELGWEPGEGLSLIACGYYREGSQVGLLGILGPMRMNYARIIPLVEHAAHMLSRELDELV
ncbi:MAG: heat-inducible transcriptional repressor HrcA [Bradymonadaceae bacterium]